MARTALEKSPASALKRPGARLQKLATAAPPPSAQTNLLWWPVVLASLLAIGPLFIWRLGSNHRLADSIWGASGALLAVAAVVAWRAIAARRTLTCETVLNPVHYVQLCMHASVYAYWGWYWREVYHYVPLILVQLVFAYALDMLVCWSRRDKWILGFGPFPIILSTNLFLWFRDDYFYLQFLLIAVGILGKEFLRWNREGRSVHIFNPSALPLFLFSVVLIATHKTGMTWGIEIATTLHNPPHIYLEIFLLGLIVQALFRVTLVTLFSAVALYILNLIYTKVTGSYNFIDSGIPVSVFLGLHLLVTDPATSPRKNFGKVIFGLMYGAGVFGMYRLLTAVGAPEFYDKLLCVPVLNLTVAGLDQLSGRVNAAFGKLTSILPRLNPKQVNYCWMAVWIAFFSTLVGTGFLAKGEEHMGGNPEYWHNSCLQGNGTGCQTWMRILNAMCESNNASACQKVGEELDEGRVMARDPEKAGVALGRACDLGVDRACSELILFAQNGGASALSKSCDDGNGAGCFVLGTLYSAGKGVAQDPDAAFRLFQKSCDTGWGRGCGRLGVSYQYGQGTPVDPGKALENFDKGCDEHNAASCYQAAQMYWVGSAGVPDKRTSADRLRQACELGLDVACKERQKIQFTR